MAHSTSNVPATVNVMASLAARLLVAGIEFEIIGVDIGVMTQIGIIVNDRYHFAAV